MYVGVHVPSATTKRRSHHRRHRRHQHHHPGIAEEGSVADNGTRSPAPGDSQSKVCDTCSFYRPTETIPPSQRVQFILGEEVDDDGTHESHPLFSEMEELCYNHEAGEVEWAETAR